MQEHHDRKMIVYFLTCASVDFFYAAFAQLPQRPAAQLYALHGKMQQQTREATVTAYAANAAGNSAVSPRYGATCYLSIAQLVSTRHPE